MKLLLVEMGPADQRNTRLTTALGYIASYLRREIPDIKIRIIRGDPAWVEQAVNDYQPDMVGISSVTQFYDIAMKAAEICHRKGAFVVIGAHHVSAVPESITPSIDLGVIGEGEDTMLDICRTFMEKGADHAAFRTIPGVVLRDDSGQIVKAERRPMHRPLDDFPFPARDLMHIRPGESVGIITSRGCPYDCEFCEASAFWNGTRFHSPEYVIAEVKEVVERYHTPHIYFWDDLFVANAKRIEQISDLMQREPLLRKVKYSLTCRANLATDKMVQLLKEMNVVEVMMGIESMSPNTLKYLKPHVTVEQNRKAVDTFHRYGVNVTAFFVIGSPQETREELELTLDYVRTAPLYRVEAYILTPLPGTPVWYDALERGLIDPNNVPWDKLYIDNPEDSTNGIHMSQTMSREEVRHYLHEFTRIRRAKDRINLIRRIPQHLRYLFESPRNEIRIVAERLRNRRLAHI